MVVPTSPPREGYVKSTEDFEKWIRMATDNKINTTNSWDLALIDYFHDLSVLRDGDGINFQKASATLDGCVKIYASRVDSAATETGRLISGLATKRNEKETATDQSAEEDSEIDEMDPDAPQRRKKSRAATKRDTLVDFKAIQLKKMDMELNVDPLFKKALADFDEGGSKSLLLNMLSVDAVGRVVFDTTESAELTRHKAGEPEDTSVLGSTPDEMDIDTAEELQDIQTDETLHEHLMNLGQRFLAMSMASEVMLCPSFQELRNVVEQKSNSAEFLKGLENVVIPETYDYSLNGNYETTYQGFDNISIRAGAKEDGFADFDDDGAFDFANDGEAPPDDTNSKYPGNKTSIFFNDLDDEADDYGVTMRMLFGEEKTFDGRHANEDHDIGSISNIPDEDILAYFDENQKKNWAGPDHWKVTRLKRSFNVSPKGDDVGHGDTEAEGQTRTRKQRERLLVDFLSVDNYPDQDMMFQQGSMAIYLPKNQWKSKDKSLLPDDRHFTTRNFISLFTKEKLITSRFNKIRNYDQAIDENLYADTVMPDQEGLPPINNADFFNDFGDDGGIDDFDDDEPAASHPISSQLLTQTRGGQTALNYSRVSKKVDIKLLKDNLWNTLKQERVSRKSVVPPTQPMTREVETLKFSEVVGGVGKKYDPQTKRDLSTSFCFICLLHLANENGFTITNNTDNTDLIINNFTQ